MEIVKKAKKDEIPTNATVLKVYIPADFDKEYKDFCYLILKDEAIRQGTTEVIKNHSQLRSFVIRRLMRGYIAQARRRLEEKAAARTAQREQRLGGEQP